MPLAFRGMRSRAVTGFVSKFTYIPHPPPTGARRAAARVGHSGCAAVRRARPPLGAPPTARDGPALSTRVSCVGLRARLAPTRP